MAEVVKRPRGRPRKLAPGPVDPVVRLALAAEKLAALYELDLNSRGLSLNPPDSGEGEILVTDDEKVAERIERTRNFSGIPRPGFYIGDEPEGILDKDGRPRGEEVLIGHSSLFGGSWGFNVGPEGAEENWASSDGDRSPGREDPGHVHRPGDSPQPEGESGSNSSPQPRGDSQERSGSDSPEV